MTIPPTLATGRLMLAPPTIADFAALAELWGNPETVRFISGQASSREESWARLLRYIGHWSAFGFGFFVMREKLMGAYVGELGLADFQREMAPSFDGYAEAGWIVDPGHWGKGYATEGLSAVIGWYDGRSDARPLACMISPGNEPSVRLARKVGFRHWMNATYRSKPTSLFRRIPSVAAEME
jgi:RimJ/RimL family protein N-acetyltransferase